MRSFDSVLNLFALAEQKKNHLCMLISQKQPYIDHNKQHYTHYKGKQSLRIQHLEKGGPGEGD